MKRFWSIIVKCTALCLGVPLFSGCPKYGEPHVSSLTVNSQQVISFDAGTYIHVEATVDGIQQPDRLELVVGDPPRTVIALYNDGIAPDKKARDKIWSAKAYWQPAWGVGSKVEVIGQLTLGTRCEPVEQYQFEVLPEKEQKQ
jgi:hypothetical protein